MPITVVDIVDAIDTLKQKYIDLLSYIEFMQKNYSEAARLLEVKTLDDSLSRAYYKAITEQDQARIAEKTRTGE